MDWRENAKRMAAEKAVQHVEDGFIVGLGSGTTVAHVFREIGRRMREEKMRVFGVPTSYQAFLQAVQHGIPITTLHEHSVIDVTIDGADQVDLELNLIKGNGGALMREKVVASTSKVNIIVVDESKLTKKLGANHPVPVEVLPFALSPVTSKMRAFGGKPILRGAERKVGPVVTDNGNFILDVHFGSIDSPQQLNQKLKAVPGLVETGLFLELAHIVYVGGKEAVRKLAK